MRNSMHHYRAGKHLNWSWVKFNTLHDRSYRSIGVDLTGLLRGRMASAEGGSVPSGVEYLPQQGPGQNPGRKRILAYFEGHRMPIFVPIWQNLGGAICISVLPLQILGDLSSPAPRDLRPCIGDEFFWGQMAGKVDSNDKLCFWLILFSELCASSYKSYM